MLHEKQPLLLPSRLHCPDCNGPIKFRGPDLHCSNCLSRYPYENGILRCFVSHQAGEGNLTETIKRFYEQSPFPNYEDIESIDSLRSKARESVIAQALEDQLPRNADILECGCGTGQLSNFLAAGNRNVYGTDLSMSSLLLAQSFAEKCGIERVSFIQMNLFRPIFKERSFDLVICNGVLHHTLDPEGGFETVASLVKPGGFIIIGLYHRYARLGTDLRRLLFRWAKVKGMRFLDPQLKRIDSAAKRQAWFVDQYLNPHESKHTIYEVRNWCAKAGFEVINTYPKTVFGGAVTTDELLFQKTELPGQLESSLTEISQVFGRSREGGFFLVVAKRQDDANVGL